MNERNGDASLEKDTKKTGAVGNELEQTVMNESNGDGDVNSLEALGSKLRSTNGFHIDNEVREEKQEIDVIIANEKTETCEIVKGISGSPEVIEEKETRPCNPILVTSGNNTVLESVCGEQFHGRECDRSPIEKVTDDKDIRGKSKSEE